MRVFCGSAQVHYIAYERTLLHIEESPKMLNKLIIYDMKNLRNWFNDIKVALNNAKTECIMFKSKTKKTSA